MLRTALRPRFLGLLALVIAVGIAFGFLGRWQLGVAESTAHREAVEQARAQAPAELTTVLEPHAPFRDDLSSRPVTATGRYAATGQLLVPGRLLDGVPGLWVLTPFVVDASGATLPVVRGFVTDPADAGSPPAGTLTIAGGLAPGESPVSEPVPEGQIGSVDLSLLVNSWPGDLYNAFVFLEAEDPATGPGLTRVPTPLADTSIQWRNAAYAVQWWVFALFAFWVWFRMVREEARRAAAGQAPEPDGTASGAIAVTQPAAGTPVGAGDNGARDD
ncbi:SURF1 family protein [Fodinibacter luteus]|uniref:SURF1-like protein n=1 Tax=Fodinibacter luteus TaxID=552064 RepID=A0ABP8JUS6_9MICO